MVPKANIILKAPAAAGRPAGRAEEEKETLNSA